MSLGTIAEDFVEFLLKFILQQFMTYLTQESEQFGSSDARDDSLFLGGQFYRWMPQRWMHSLDLR
jgi:hypothetical protein